MCFFWHLSGSLPPWPPTVKIVYGWNICRHWWDTLSYKPHDHMAIVIIVTGLIIRIIVSLSSSSSADPFDFSILWAFVRSALPSSRTLCQESLLEKRTVNHIIIIVIIIIVNYILNIIVITLSSSSSPFHSPSLYLWIYDLYYQQKILCFIMDTSWHHTINIQWEIDKFYSLSLSFFRD